MGEKDRHTDTHVARKKYKDRQADGDRERVIEINSEREIQT